MSYRPTKQFNEDTSYNINPTGSKLIVEPYTRSKIRDDTQENEKYRPYKNKFTDTNVHRFNDDPIEIEPKKLERLQRKATQRIKPAENVFSQTKVSYVNVDSRQRNRYPINNYTENFKTLPSYPLQFTNGSPTMTILEDNHNIVVNDKIIINNVVSKNVVLQDVLSVKKNASYMRVYHPNHGLTFFGLFDPVSSDQFTPVNYVHVLPATFTPTQDIPDGVNQYYILTINSTLDFYNKYGNIKGSDFTRTFIGNNSINTLNKKQLVYLLFTKNGTNFVSDPDYYLIKLERVSSINYQDGISFLTDNNGNATSILATNTTTIHFYNLFGVPLNFINTGTPITQDRTYPYFIVNSVTANSYSVTLNINAIIDTSNPAYSFYNYTDNLDPNFDPSLLIGGNRGGGGICVVRKISTITGGYPNPNQYVFILDRTYKNITQTRILSSAFPNSQRTVNNQPYDIQNNKIYWRNLDDGTQIYFIEATPGNYSPEQFAVELERQFGTVIRYEYTQEFANGIVQTIVTSSTPVDYALYDSNGYYKYNIIKVKIDRHTDIVTFSAFRQLVEQDTLNMYQVLVIPDFDIEFTQASNLQVQSDLIACYLGVGTDMNPFDPSAGEVLYIFFTQNSHLLISGSFPYMYGNLYRYTGHIAPSLPTDAGFNTYGAQLVVDVAILVNFYRDKGVGGNAVSTQEVNSINTTTIFNNNFTFNSLNNLVYFPHHGMKVGDLIITDQLPDPLTPTEIFVYVINTIIDPDSFFVTRYQHGSTVKFIYDSLIINFVAVPDASYPATTGAIQYLDQITVPPPIASATFSFAVVAPTGANCQIMQVLHPDHQLDVGTQVTLSESGSVNRVPAETINGTHTIIRVVDDDHYQVQLNIYIPLATVTPLTQLNTVSILYPDLFQLLFNYDDTLGHYLGFLKVGQTIAITPFQSVLTNQTLYEEDYNYESLGAEFVERTKKLSMTGDNYCYIVSAELSSDTFSYYNTGMVTNVINRVYWTDFPGTVVFNSFDPVVIEYDDPISSLSQFTIQIYHPDGNLVEFNDLNHSFTLEITEVFNEPDETNINVRINSEQIVRHV